MYFLGIAINTSYPVNTKWSGQGKNKSEKRAHVRKKAPPNVTILPEGAEHIPSSTSQDEADTEDSPSKLRKRRKLLRKSRAKKQKGIDYWSYSLFKNSKFASYIIISPLNIPYVKFFLIFKAKKFI